MHQFLLLFLLSSWKPLFFSFLFIKHFLKMALSFQIKVFNIFRIINFFSINFFISHNDWFPNSFIRFFKCNIDILLILNIPKWLISLNSPSIIATSYPLILTNRCFGNILISTYFDVVPYGTGIYIDTSKILWLQLYLSVESPL